MEDIEKLELEANKILNKYNIAEVCDQALLDELLYGTSCIVITEDEVVRVEPLSKESILSLYHCLSLASFLALDILWSLNIVGFSII